MEDVKIRQLNDSESDYRLLEKWYQEEDIYSSFEQRRLTYEEIKNKYYPRTLSNSNVVVYMIEYSDKPVGIIQYKLVKDDKKLYQITSDNVYEMDIFIGELEFQHKGIGSKGVELLSNYLFNEKHADYLVMCPLSNNIKAINCYKKCGFYIKRYYETEDTIGQMQKYVLMVKEPY